MNLYNLILILLTASISINSFAGDNANLDFIGYSKNGKYVAFEQYGVNDGNGLHYSEIFIVNVISNIYAIKPIKSKPNDDSKLSTLRKKIKFQAQAKLNKFKIDQEIIGKKLISHPLSDVGVANKTATFIYNFDKFNLKLTEFLAKPVKDCFGFGQAKIFKLSLTKNNGKSKILQKDKKLPKSRDCPLNYRIQDVFVYQDKYIVVFLNMFLTGFEGKNMRYLAITGTLN
jgi:predicted secreted protein